MKQCPKCKKEVAEHAKICPYCGYNLEPGYRPMQRKNKPLTGILYVVMAFIFMFSPMILGYIFNTSSLTSSLVTEETGKRITLGSLGDVENIDEYIKYHFEDLELFNKRVADVKPMVTNIKNFEKELTDVTKHKIDKKYNIYITDLNNIYYDITYTIVTAEQEYLKVNLHYDLAKVTNEVDIQLYRQGKTNFEEVKYQEETYQIVENIVSLVTEKENNSLVQKVGSEFNDLETTFEQRKETLGHYGVGLNKVDKNDTYSMYVTGYVDDYTVKAEYQTILKLNKFI